MKRKPIKQLFAPVLVVCLLLAGLPFSAWGAVANQALELSIGTTIDNSISSTDEEDMYAFTLRDTGAVTLNVTSRMKYYSLFLLNSDGEEIWKSTNNEYNENVGFRKDGYIIDLKEGAYYLRVTGKAYYTLRTDSSTGDYQIITSFKSANVTESEPNDTARNANTFTLGESIRGQIAVDNDQDVYGFTVGESGTVSFDITSYMQYYSLFLLDDVGEEIWKSTSNEFNENVGYRQDNYELDLQAGTYFLQVTGKAYYTLQTPSSTGNYTIISSFVESNATETEPNNTASDADLLRLNNDVRGHIAIGDDRDMYAVELDADAVLHIKITSYMGSYSVDMYDSTGGKVWESHSNLAESPTNYREDTYEVDLEAGKYYIEMSGNQYRVLNTIHYTGIYTLWVGTSAFPETPDVEEPDNPTRRPFTDVRSGDYFYAPVQWAMEKNITSGTSATTFSPNQACTRAQAVMFLWKAAGQPEPTRTSNPFRDVKSSDYYYKAVLWAVENNITSGTSDTTFSPNQSCTRGQIMTFLYKAAGSPSVSGSNPFRDVAYGDYFYRPVLWAVRNDITSGTSATAFSPSASCTRGQIVTFLYKHYA